MQIRYHIQLNNKRTTISVDNIISDLLAFKLGFHPENAAAYPAIRAWFEQTIRNKLGNNLPRNSRVSQWARIYAIEAIADPDLMEKVWDSRIGKELP